MKYRSKKLKFKKLHFSIWIAMAAFISSSLSVSETALAKTEPLKKSDSAQVLETSQGEFSVSLTADKSLVEVLPVKPKGELPPYLRMRVLSEQDPPVEVRLQTMRRNDVPLRYSGQLNNLNSYVGLELEFSFDQKTWSKFGKTLSSFFKR